jgi:hypothetical protein
MLVRKAGSKHAGAKRCMETSSGLLFIVSRMHQQRDDHGTRFVHLDIIEVDPKRWAITQSVSSIIANIGTAAWRQRRTVTTVMEGTFRYWEQAAETKGSLTGKMSWDPIASRRLEEVGTGRAAVVWYQSF